MQTRWLRPLLLWSVGLVLLAVAGAALRFGLLGNPWSRYEKGTLNPGFRSSATPDDLGVPFQRVSIVSGSRHLDGFFVPAAAECQKRAAVLIFHGRNETIADWIGAQKRFRDACVASL